MEQYNLFSNQHKRTQITTNQYFISNGILIAILKGTYQDFVFLDISINFYSIYFTYMLRHYFTISWRNLIRHRTFSLINIIGLALGLTCCCLIALFVQHELSFDQFHANHQEIYRLTTTFDDEDGIETISLTPSILLPLLEETYPEKITAGARMYFTTSFIRNDTDRFKEPGLLFTDPQFFEIFSFNSIKGNPAEVLSRPDAIVLTTSAAQKYFGKDDPIGKVLYLGSDSTQYAVGAVIEDIPSNSSFSFEVVLPFTTLGMAKKPSFSPANYHTFIQIKNRNWVDEIQADIPTLLNTHADSEYAQTTAFSFQEIDNMYLHSSHIEADEDIKSGNIGFIYIMISLASLILLIACFNYINLSTARNIDRAKEVAMRKVIGAKMNQLRIQFLGESALITFLALSLALLFSELLLPYFNQLSQRQIDSSVMFHPIFISILLLIGIFTGILAGGYPAIILSKLKPIEMLRGSFRFSEKGGFLRKGLVIAQFAGSVVLLIGVLVVQRQLSFIQNKKLGFDKEQVIILPVHWQEYKQAEVLERTLEQLPFTAHVSRCTESPHQIRGTYSLWPSGDETKEISVKALAIDEDFVESLRLEIVSGTDINSSDMANEGESYHFLINEEAAESLGWNSETAVGQHVNLHNRVGIIKGVVKNFHFASLHQPIGPMAMYSKGFRQTMLVRLVPGNISDQLTQIESEWNAHIQYQPFEYRFLDEQLARMYEDEQHAKQLATNFALLALFIAAMGLMGLANYTVAQRNKEISIRKVLGASVINISILLTKDFLRPITIAFLIGFPIAYMFMNAWLQNFSYRIEIGLSELLVSGIICFVVAWFAMGIQTLKAASANPVDTLRQE